MSVAGDAGLDKRDSRKSAVKVNGGGDAVWRGFINVNLNAGQKEQFEDWSRTDEPMDILAQVVGSGAHVAIKVNQDGGGFMASITQRNPAHVNAGLCVSARSGEAWKALFRALFLVAVLGVDQDWSVGQSPADPDRW